MSSELAGLGVLIISIGIVMVMVFFVKMIHNHQRLDSLFERKMETLEHVLLGKVLTEKKINIDMELMKLLENENQRSKFRKQIYKDMLEEYTGKEKLPEKK